MTVFYLPWYPSCFPLWISSAPWPGWTWLLVVTNLDILPVSLCGWCLQLPDMVGQDDCFLLTLISSLFPSVDVFSSLTWLDMMTGCYWPWYPPCFPLWKSSAPWPGWTWWLFFTNLDILPVSLCGCLQLPDLVGHDDWLLLTLMSSLFPSVEVFSSLTWLDMVTDCYWPWCPPCFPLWKSSAPWPGWTWWLAVTDLDVLPVSLCGSLHLSDLVGHGDWLLLTLMSSLFPSVEVFSSLTWLDMMTGCY